MPPEYSLRASLRHATSQLHHQLDASPLLQRLNEPGLQRSSYIAILQGFHSAYSLVEPELLRLSHTRPAQLCAYRPRLSAVEADLLALGATVPPQTVQFEPPVVSSIGALPFYLGMRYVLEGSTQGARQLSAQLEHHWPQLKREGFAYWELQRQAADDWREVRRFLEACPASPALAAAGAGARYVFGVFITVFCPTEVSS